MVEKQLDRKKHTSGEAPKVCSVCTITCSQAMLAADAARSPQPRARRSPQRDLTRGHSRDGVRHASRYERLPQANRAARCCP